jgi:hypothetical protein
MVGKGQDKEIIVDREATVGGKKGMGGLTLKTICFLIADMFGCIGGMSLLFPLAIA